MIQRTKRFHPHEMQKQNQRCNSLESGHVQDKKKPLNLMRDHTFNLLPPAASIDRASKMTIAVFNGLQFLAALISDSSSKQYWKINTTIVQP